VALIFKRSIKLGRIIAGSGDRSRQQCILPDQTEKMFMPKSKNKIKTEAQAAGRPVSAVPAPGEFTIEDHFRVQRDIEERAHRFWFAKGCALKSALNDWLKAEEEVLAEFILYEHHAK
jgi:hypothetical protein